MYTVSDELDFGSRQSHVKRMRESTEGLQRPKQVLDSIRVCRSTAKSHSSDLWSQSDCWNKFLSTDLNSDLFTQQVV